MEDLIPIVNKLLDAFTSMDVHMDLDLPQIAVVGGQSDGKSSVLENFVGRDFLPRGAGMVTRRPLILQLINGSDEYGMFMHIKDKKFTDFTQVRKEIEDDTDRITSGDKCISTVPINLCIHSPNVLNLTLIDLPGLTKVPIGDQPADIENQIKDMIFQFIHKDTCLILAVIPANSDLANSDALKLAKEVDPQGVRTIGVITKLDLMDEGTDAREILENKLLPLRRGYIGVVNRSQKDIDGRKDIQAALAAEKLFLQNHPSYQDLADRLGTSYLQKFLNKQLTEHIHKKLPVLRKQCIDKKREAEKVLKKYGPTDLTENVSATFKELMDKLGQDFECFIDGFGSDEALMSEELASAEIKNLFHETLRDEVHDMKNDEQEIQKGIAKAIKKCHGLNPGLFAPERAFKQVAATQIAELKKPVLSCLDLVVVKLRNVLHNRIEKNMSHYPMLCREVGNLIDKQLRKGEKECSDQLSRQIKQETYYMNTKNAEFVKLSELPLNTVKNATPHHADYDYKGYLEVYDKKGLKIRTWCSLTNSNRSDHRRSEAAKLYCYLDENPKVLFSEFKEFGIKIMKRGLAPPVFLLTPNSFNNSHHLQLFCDDFTEFTKWKAAFEMNEVLYSPNIDESHLHQQAESIRRNAGHYLEVITKKILDTFPKAITMYILEDLKDFLKIKLFRELNTPEKLAEVMVENSVDKAKREGAMKMVEACDKALSIIDQQETNFRYGFRLID